MGTGAGKSDASATAATQTQVRPVNKSNPGPKSRDKDGKRQQPNVDSATTQAHKKVATGKSKREAMSGSNVTGANKQDGRPAEQEGDSVQVCSPARKTTPKKQESFGNREDEVKKMFKVNKEALRAGRFEQTMKGNQSRRMKLIESKRLQNQMESESNNGSEKAGLNESESNKGSEKAGLNEPATELPRLDIPQVESVDSQDYARLNSPSGQVSLTSDDANFFENLENGFNSDLKKIQDNIANIEDGMSFDSL